MTHPFDDFDTQIQCEEYYDIPDPEEEDREDWPPSEQLPFEDDEDSTLIDKNGGITAEGYALLADLERQGFFV